MANTAMEASTKNNIVNRESFSTKDVMPIMDYSMLVCDDLNQQSEAVRELGNACTQYGYFMVINHGVPEELIRRVTDAFFEFFDLSEKKKKTYETNDAADRIRWGKGDINFVSREFIKFASHPTLYCPSKPPAISELMKEYNKRVRDVGIELLRGVSKALGLDEKYIEKAMKLEEGYDFYTANDYPSRMESEKPTGQMAHTDPGLLILLMQNVTGGLQMEHHGKWVDANLQPYSLVVSIADQFEILTNGKYKSKVHRVLVNNETRRFTLPLFLGPALDTVVEPAPEFVDDIHPPAYHGMTYKEYLEANEFHIIDGKSCLNQIRL